MKKCFFLVMLSFVSCKALLDKYFDSAPDDWKDTEYSPAKESKYNKDNIVFRTNRSFMYKMTEDSLSIEKTAYIKLLVLTGKVYDQTKIKYKYCKSLTDTGRTTELAGVYEDRKEIFLHPPRSITMLLEFAPFIEIHFPLKIGKTWKSGLVTSNGWGKYEHIRVKTEFKVTGRDSIDPELYYLKGIAVSSLGVSTLDYSFHCKRGFIKLSYELIDKKKLIFELIDVVSASSSQ